MMITVGYYEAPAVFKVFDDLSNLRRPDNQHNDTLHNNFEM
jgi:hypothetical protein